MSLISSGGRDALGFGFLIRLERVMTDLVDFRQNAEAPLKEISSSGAMSSESWAWVELNYRPHAYQATEWE